MEQRVRITLAGAVGNLLEWYDFGLYGLLAPVLASLFFPGHDRIASLLAVYGGFAGGFAMRPIGAAALGYLADRVGRRFVLVLSVVLMGVSTVAVGLLPTYATVGVWAPVLLIVIRLLQGFSVGGEFVDSVTYLVEAAPDRRGFAGSFANLGSTAGMLLGAGAAAALTSFANTATIAAWAWRMPFLLGGVIASAAYFLRRHLPETYVSKKLSEANGKASVSKESPLRQAIRKQPGILLATLLFTSGYGITNYVTMVLLPTYAREISHIADQQALRINAAGQALALFIVPLAGWCSDHLWRRRTMLMVAFAVEAAFAWRAFLLVDHHGAAGLWIAQLAFAFLLAVVMGTAPAMLSEQFEPEYRVSAHAVAFNIGIGIFGGTAPMVAMGLIRLTGNRMVPAGYLMAAAAMAAISARMLRDRSRDRLTQEQGEEVRS
jgi:MFS transporter, MHS family, proline/betaine transporter